MRLIGALALLTAIVATGAASATQPGVTISVAGQIGYFSADGGRVAVDVQSSRGGRPCYRVVVWAPPATRTTAIGGPHCRTAGGPEAPVGLTLADSRLAWWSYSSGNHVYCDGLFTAVVGARAATDLNPPDCDGASPDACWEFAGNGPLLVARKFQVCDLDCAPDYNSTYETDIELYRVGSKLTEIRPLARNTQLEAVNSGRLLLGHAKQLEVVRPLPGNEAVHIDLPPGFDTTPSSHRLTTVAFLSGNDVAAVQSSTVAEFDATTGKLVVTRRLHEVPGGGTSRVRGFDGGVLLYENVSGVRLLRLADGRDVVVTPTPRPALGVDEQLTPAGLFYAYESPPRLGFPPNLGPTPGRVYFLPHAAVTRLLG